MYIEKGNVHFFFNKNRISELQKKHEFWGGIQERIGKISLLKGHFQTEFFYW